MPVKMCTVCKIMQRAEKHPGLCMQCRRDKAKEYSRTTKGYLVRTYRAMLNRVRGINKKSGDTYLGLPICNKRDFYSWSLKDSQRYKELLKAYRDSGYDRCKAPSVDRIVPELGYILHNMRWLTLSENSSITSSNNKPSGLPIGICMRKGNFLVSKSVAGGKYVREFKSLEAAKKYLKYIER